MVESKKYCKESKKKNVIKKISCDKKIKYSEKIKI